MTIRLPKPRISIRSPLLEGLGHPIEDEVDHEVRLLLGHSYAPRRATSIRSDLFIPHPRLDRRCTIARHGCHPRLSENPIRRRNS